MKNMKKLIFFVSGPELLNGFAYLHEILSRNVLNTQDVPFVGFKALMNTENLKFLKKYKNSINSNCPPFGQFQSYLHEIL